MEKVQAKLKHKIEDFIVEEIQEEHNCKISKDFIQPKIKVDKSERDFLWCEMEKKDIDHFTAIKEIANQLDKGVQAIGYGGIKDKIAHTSQRISIERPSIEKIKSFSHPNIILKNFKWNKRKIKIGYLKANHFKITLRDINRKDAIKISSGIRKKTFFPNYFGPQRFGINRSNIEIGKEIIKRNFKKALQLIQEDKGWEQTETNKEPLSIIKYLPKKILLMYINAVQSIIFNDIVSQALEEGLDLSQKGQQSGILAGYKTRFSNGTLGKIEREVLEKHGLELNDFDIQEIPILRTKGSFRKAITSIEDLQVETENDEEFEGSKKIILEFTLPSGTYATTFLENFFIFN
ncbi:MAG: tRNA pseudouridine(13) synthase TruD [archaeon]